MRRQTAQAGASRQEILAGDPRPGTFMFHARAIRRPEPIGYHTMYRIVWLPELSVLDERARLTIGVVAAMVPADPTTLARSGSPARG